MITHHNNNPDTSNCYGRSFNNIPIVYAQLENTIQAKNWYQTIIVCSIKNLRPPELDLPELILCLDCVDDISDSEDFAFIRTVALLVALAFADAVLGMGISNRELVTSKLNQQVKPENDYD